MLSWAEYFPCSPRNHSGQDLQPRSLVRVLMIQHWSHSHFNTWYYHVIHFCQNRVREPIFDSRNSLVNPFPNSVGNISSNYLIMPCTVFNDCWSLKLQTIPSVEGSTISPLGTSALAILPTMTSFKDSFIWLKNLSFWWFFCKRKPYFYQQVKYSKPMKSTDHQQTER